MPLFYPDRIDIYHHIALDGAAAGKLNQALTLLQEIKQGLNRLETKMSQEFDTVDALLEDVKQATDQNAEAVEAQTTAINDQGTAIDGESSRLDVMIAELRNSNGMTGAELNAVAEKAASIKANISAAKAKIVTSTTALNDEVERLKAVGVDPANPTPEPE